MITNLLLIAEPATPWNIVTQIDQQARIRAIVESKQLFTLKEQQSGPNHLEVAEAAGSLGSLYEFVNIRKPRRFSNAHWRSAIPLPANCSVSRSCMQSRIALLKRSRSVNGLWLSLRRNSDRTTRFERSRYWIITRTSCASWAIWRRRKPSRPELRRFEQRTAV